MRLTQLWLTDFRNYDGAELELPPGLTVVVGDNGAGKTNLLEAVGYLATLESFRGAPAEALVRLGCERAVVRGAAIRGEREVLVEAEIRPGPGPGGGQPPAPAAGSRPGGGAGGERVRPR